MAKSGCSAGLSHAARYRELGQGHLRSLAPPRFRRRRARLARGCEDHVAGRITCRILADLEMGSGQRAAQAA